MVDRQSLDVLHDIFVQFCLHGKGHHHHQDPRMDNRALVKLAKDADLRRLKTTDCDLIFASVKSKGMKTIDFEEFLRAVELMAERVRTTPAKLVNKINKVQGPAITGTRAEPNRFHDDRSLYTGVHAKGGPSTIGGADHGSIVQMENLLDRSMPDVRGRKKAPRRDNRLSLQSMGGMVGEPAAAAAMPAALTYDRGAYGAPPPPVPPAVTGAYGSPAAMGYGGGYGGAPMMDSSPYLAQAGPPPDDPRLQVRARQTPDRPRSRGGRSIFDKLTDPRLYTGHHRHRFDDDGKGRGAAGRDLPSLGHSPFARKATTSYVGNTNTNTDEVFTSPAQFLCRS